METSVTKMTEPTYTPNAQRMPQADTKNKATDQKQRSGAWEEAVEGERRRKLRAVLARDGKT
eukprot:scaffold301127_cov40-Tisochrysis_lutea.AAC.1